MNWKAELITYKGEKRIAVIFAKNARLIARIKTFDGARWSASKKYWHLPDTIDNRIRFKISSPLLPSMEGIQQLEQFKHWLQSKRYSENTIKTYSEALQSFLTFFNQKSVFEITNDDVILYNTAYILKNKLSSSYQNQIVNAIKLYFKTIRNEVLVIEKIHRPKREKILPNGFE
ncbi:MULTISPECIES: site-specific integrase [Flavobacterium]|nr:MULTISPECIES: site-specific integrase [Flavobacterium]